VITRESLRAFRLAPRSVIEADAESFHEALLSPAKNQPVGSAQQRVAAEAPFIADLQRRGRALGTRILPTDARPMLRKVLAVVGDGALQRLPFPLLDLGAAGESASAAAPEKRAYVYLPSISTLRALRTLPRSSATPGSVAVIADPVFRVDDTRLAGRATPTSTSGSTSSNEMVLRAASEAGAADLRRLPFTREEAQGIRSVADRSSWIALDFAANRKAALEAQWSRYSIVHFATHALVNSRHPELSGIVLSLYGPDGRGEDGFLRASDIFNLTMPADLVVLSVCDSAVGKDVGAEGQATLARAFFYAGAHRVVASLWPVDDRASVAFMRSFYAALIEQRLAPHDALAAAQRDLRSNPRWRNPYYWAPYVLLGDWR
jgi:CHAT domain-containing protein